MPLPLTRLASELHRLAESSAPDADLLERYARHRDEAAFTTLVERHGPMVLRLCRRVLGDAHSAEDALQATFLVLARKAGSLNRPAALPGWIYGVAQRLALKARRAGRRRPITTASAVEPPDPAPDPLMALTARDLLVAMEEELARLPATYRMAVVACCLEGHSRDEAATLLGCTTGALRGWLERGRARLHMRLVRRGLTLSAALAAAEIAQCSVGATAIAAAVKRTTAAGTASAAATQLAAEALRGAGLGRLPAVLLLIVAVGISAMWLAPAPEMPTDPPPREGTAGQPPDSPAAAVDRFGDPLPSGALARMGTARLRGQVVAFSADSRTLITAGADRALHYWDVADGKERQRKQLAFSVLSSRFDVVHLHSGVSSDGQKYIAADNETIRVWETATGKELCKIANPTFSFNRKSLSRLAVSNDGRYIAAALLDFNARKCPVVLHDTATGKQHQFMFEDRDYGYPAFSVDGKILIIAGQQGVIRFYETATAKLEREMNTMQIKANPSHPAVSPSNRLAWMDGDRKIKVLSIADGTEKASFEIPDFGRVDHLAFARDGVHLVLATEKGVLIWDTAARKQLHKITRPEAQSFIGRQTGRPAFSPDGKILAVSHPSGAELYDVATGKLLLQPKGFALTRGMALAFSRDGQTLASAGHDGLPIYLWEAATGKPFRWIDRADFSSTLLFSPDGKEIIAEDGNGVIQFWSAKTGDRVRRLDLNEDKDDKIRYGVTRLASDGKTITALGACFDGKAHHRRYAVWDLATGAVQKRVGVPVNYSEMFAPNGTLLHPMDKIVLRDALSGKQVVKLEDAIFGPYCFTPDGKNLAVASSDAATYLDLASGRVLARLRTGKVGDLELSPDGRFLAAISREELVLWEIATAKPAFRLPAPAPYSATDGVAFSLRTEFAPDGRSLATGLKDTTIVIWDIAPGLRRGPAPAKELGRERFETLWANLAAEDAAKAYRAIWTLAGAPDQAVAFLKAKLKPAVDNGKRIARLIVELDSEELAVRTAAAEELHDLDIEIEPACRRAMAAGVTIECKRRMERFLELPFAIARGPETLRGVRAIQVLEATGTPAARELLKLLATGAGDARLTRDAKESLVRLK